LPVAVLELPIGVKTISKYGHYFAPDQWCLTFV